MIKYFTKFGTSPGGQNPVFYMACDESWEKTLCFARVGRALVAKSSYLMRFGQALVAKPSYFTRFGRALVAKPSYFTRVGRALVARPLYFTRFGQALVAKLCYFTRFGRALVAKPSYFTRVGRALVATPRYFTRFRAELGHPGNPNLEFYRVWGTPAVETPTFIVFRLAPGGVVGTRALWQEDLAGSGTIWHSF